MSWILAAYIVLIALPSIGSLQLNGEAAGRSANGHLLWRPESENCRDGAVVEYDQLSDDEWDWDADPDPPWLMPEMTGAPPKGAKIAIAFRGAYFRTHGPWCSNDIDKGWCSDFYANEENIRRYVISPLEAAGAEVRNYLCTFSYDDSRDSQLGSDLKPARSTFDEDREKPQANNSREAIELVVADNWADYMISIRFDVSYYAPITSLNIDWDSVNFGWRGSNNEGGGGLVCDAIYVLPRKHMEKFSEAFTTAYSHCGNKLMCTHYLYDPTVELVGQDSVHFIDDSKEGYRMQDTHRMFLYINRQCS